MNPTFDTLKASKNLIAHGIAKEHAEAIVSTFSEYQGDIATKQDLAQFATKEDLEKFATKKDLEKFSTKDELKKEIAEMQAKLTIRIPGIIIGYLTLVAAILKFIHFAT